MRISKIITVQKLPRSMNVRPESRSNSTGFLIMFLLMAVCLQLFTVFQADDFLQMKENVGNIEGKHALYFAFYAEDEASYIF